VFQENLYEHPDKAYNYWKNEKRFNKNKLRDHSVYANTGAIRSRKGNK